jgi:AraC-like DNA-binding protein
VILREVPDVPPRPLTPQNQAFRRSFYARWGRENSIIVSHTRHAELARYKHPLSIKAVWGGVAEHAVDSRNILVDDDAYLVLNEDQTYSSSFRSDGNMHAVCLFVRRGLPGEVAGAMTQSLPQALDAESDADADPDPDANMARRPVEFAESLRPHDSVITPQLRSMQQQVEDGMSDQGWLDEQVTLLLEKLIHSEHRLRARHRNIRSVRASTREELARRIGWAADYMLSGYADPISLDDVAAAARLSKYHLIRLFQQVHGVTPHVFLQNKRARVARRLIEGTELDLAEIASLAGFGTRWTMFRQLRRVFGVGGLDLRQSLHPSAWRAARRDSEAENAALLQS